MKPRVPKAPTETLKPEHSKGRVRSIGRKAVGLAKRAKAAYAANQLSMQQSDERQKQMPTLQARLAEVRSESERNPFLNSLGNSLNMLLDRQKREGVRFTELPRMGHHEGSSDVVSASKYDSATLVVAHRHHGNQFKLLAANKDSSLATPSFASGYSIAELTISRDTDLAVDTDVATDRFRVRVETEKQQPERYTPGYWQRYDVFDFTFAAAPDGRLAWDANIEYRNHKNVPTARQPYELTRDQAEAFIQQVELIAHANAGVEELAV